MHVWIGKIELDRCLSVSYFIYICISDLIRLGNEEKKKTNRIKTRQSLGYNNKNSGHSEMLDPIPCHFMIIIYIGWIIESEISRKEKKKNSSNTSFNIP